MNDLQKLFLIMVAGYLAVKVIIALIMNLVTKRIEKKGKEFQKKRLAHKNKEAG
ncbi:MAG: hypothetical protein ACM3MK_02250 [Chitinophagales bacterium]